MKHLFFLIAFLYFSNSFSQIPLSYYLPNTRNLDTKITSPEEFLGFQIGEWHVNHSQLLYYMRTLANESERIQYVEHGKTHEDRPLFALIITDPENQKNLESIKKEHIKISTPGQEKSVDIEKEPLVVWQGYSIHGNEASGSNAAMLAAYYLAASNTREIKDILENTVIIFYPSFNPDGLQRFSSWVNRHKNKVLTPDNQDREYEEVWPGGRTNHYWFDLNRDWLPLQQPESKAKIALFQEWRPNILTDHHEMGTNSSFFFQPGIPSRTHPLTPKINQELTEEIGKFHSQSLDSIGSLYYSKENYDDFYYGKGSTYPDIQGCIGILFEQASSRGHIQHSANGILTFPFTIRNQFVTSLSTLRAGLKLRQDLLSYQRDFYKNIKGNKEGYVFGGNRDSYKTYKLAEILKAHTIDFYELRENIEVDNQTFTPESSFYVPLDQRQQTLVKAIFETNSSFQDSLFYDVSAWTFPLAFNLPYQKVSNVKAKVKVSDLRFPSTSFSTDATYAYLIPWNQYLAPKALFRLLDAGIRVKVGQKPFAFNGIDYSYGTLMIPLQNQDKNTIEKILGIVCKEDGLAVNAISTGATKKVNLGSLNFRTVRKPNIAIIVGEGTSSSGSGEAWHLLDTRYEIPITKLDGSQFSSFDLTPYNVIILAGGRISSFDKNKFQQWIRKGGTFITMGSAGKWISGQNIGKFTYKDSPSEKEVPVNYAGIGDYYGARYTGGSIMQTKIDPSHPILFGFEQEFLPVFKNNNYVFEPSEQQFKNPLTYTESPLISGYLHSSNREIISKGSALQVGGEGRGRIINFADNPNFRAFWYGTNKLFANAIFFGHMVSGRAVN